MGARDELEIMRDLRGLLMELPVAARLRALRWLQAAVTDTPPANTRGLSDKWRELMSAVGAQETFSFDDVMRSSAAVEFGIKRNAVRAQIHNYVLRGYLTATPEAGCYAWSPEGRAELLGGTAEGEDG